MSKELTPLEALNYLSFNSLSYENRDKHVDTIETALKALEIIKINASNITLLLLCESYDMYVELSGNHMLKEEYDLVMEVLL